MALDTVADYVREARVLIQDTVAPYRYPDPNFLISLNLALLESRRLRADLWIDASVPSFSVVDTTAVDFDEQYRSAILFYMSGYVQLIDAEETQDTRAAALIAKSAAILTGVTA